MRLKDRKEVKILVLIILLGLGLRLAGSALYPTWSGAEEGSHFFFIQYIGENKELPMIPLTEETLRSIYVESIHQPPLYYMTMAPFYNLVANQSNEAIVHFLRLFSVLLGTLCIPLTYFIAKKLSFGKNIAIASALFVALLPTNIIATSVLGNDALSWVFCTAAIYFCIAALQNKKALDLALAGLLIAAAILTKFNALSLLAIFIPTALILLFGGKENIAKRIIACLTPLLAVPIIFRNLALSGSIIPSHLRNMMVINWEWFVYYTTHLFPSFWLQEYAVATIPDVRYLFFAFYAAISLAAVVGFAKLLLDRDWGIKRKLTATILLLGVLLNLAGITYVNLSGWWPEGRWLYPTLSIIVIFFILGLQKFMKLIKQPKKAPYLIWFVLLTMLVLDIIVLVFHNTVLPDIVWAIPV